MLLNYLDPETFLNLKTTFPKCEPEYPYVEHLPGLTLAFKSKCYLVKKGGKGSRLLSKFNGSPNEKHPQPSLYNDVVIMALENHAPFSYDSNRVNQYCFHLTPDLSPSLFPFVKPGDIFPKLQVEAGLSYPNGRVYPSVVFHNSAGRIKYIGLEN
jgi:hypothetical protein